jgi:protein phosphatase
VDGPDDVRLAPFHLLAGESGVYVERDHAWHLDAIDRVAAASGSDGLVIRTNRQVVDVTDAASEQAAVAWWEELTAGGGEGMVVKPLSFVARGRKGLVQPGIKCRGRDYLRIIYGPEYAEPDQIERLRSRSLGRKRSLALREFGLGVEALERFARREPLYRVHECVFAVLALESEPVDPRL